MIYSKERKASGGGRRQTRNGTVVVLLIVTAIAAVVAVGLLGVFDAFPFGVNRRDAALVSAWSQGDYAQVIETAEETLTAHPLDGQALTYGGFAHFYRGVDLVDADEREADISRAIVLLRKASHLSRAPLPAQRDYVLGKAYYHSGPLYADLAVQHLEQSIAQGYEASDSLQYLGLAYAPRGQYEASAERFVEAVQQTEDWQAGESLRINAAESLIALEDYDQAKGYLEEVIDRTTDPYIALIARNLLTSALILNDELEAAEDLVTETIEDYPLSADAYYYLGIVYDLTDREVEARAMWRQARDIDPDHIGAQQRLAY